jgi:hypothetical protein
MLSASEKQQVANEMTGRRKCDSSPICLEVAHLKEESSRHRTGFLSRLNKRATNHIYYRTQTISVTVSVKQCPFA